ncbi:MAG: nucleoside monophosphate kinase [Candidatus Woesearchaeota archaeon]|nr:nucleoside monophosphate kinase [Candidatus Woesearchaeota archaeon]
MIITISGKPGSGKSTVAKLVARKLGLKHHSIGDLWRGMAAERNMTILDFNKLVEKDKDIDIETDRKQEELGRKEDNFVIDGRMSFHFIPKSTKVFLDVNEEEGAKRIFQQNRGGVEQFSEFDDALESIQRREMSETKRYKKLYKVNYTDHSNFDIVIDTTRMPPEKVAEKIVKTISMFKEAKRKQNL